jgi:hypothetical protein
MEYSYKANQEFIRVCKGVNFITNEIVNFFEIPSGYVELSKGKFLTSTVYGVTVITDGELNYDLSKNFETDYEAYKYIHTL